MKRNIVGWGLAILMSPFIAVGFVGKFILAYIECGAELFVVASEELDKRLGE